MNDEVVGAVHSGPDPGMDETVGGNQQQSGASNQTWLDKAWTNLTEAAKNANKPVFDQAPDAPFLTAMGHGVKNFIDTNAARLADVGSSIGLSSIGPTSDQIRADQAQRNAALQARFPNAQDQVKWGLTAGEALPAAAVMGPFTALVPEVAAAGVPGIALRAGARAATGGATGAGGAWLTGGDPIQGAATGAVLGPILGIGGDMATWLARKATGQQIALTPEGQVQPQIRENAQHAQVLQDEGVPVLGSQLRTDPDAAKVQAASEVVPLSSSGQFYEHQLDQFRQAALAKAGAPPGTSIANDATVGALKTQAGNDIDTVVNANPFPYSAVRPGLDNIRTNINRYGLSSDGRDQINSVLNDIYDRTVNNRGVINGQLFRSFTDTNSTLDSLIGGSDAAVANVARQIKNEIKGGFNSVASPQAQGDLTSALQRYRVASEIDTARGSGGTFTPQDLYKAVSANAKKYGDGSQLSDLATAGDNLIKPPGGTAAQIAGGVGSFVPFGASVLARDVLPTMVADPTVTAPLTAALIAANRMFQRGNQNPERVRSLLNLSAGSGRQPYGYGLLNVPATTAAGVRQPEP
jgi:hypothetical protein